MSLNNWFCKFFTERFSLLNRLFIIMNHYWINESGKGKYTENICYTTRIIILDTSKPESSARTPATSVGPAVSAAAAAVATEHNPSMKMQRHRELPSQSCQCRRSMSSWPHHWTCICPSITQRRKTNSCQLTEGVKCHFMVFAPFHIQLSATWTLAGRIQETLLHPVFFLFRVVVFVFSISLS